MGIMAGLPLVEELHPCPDVAEVLRAFADQPGLLLLESALQRAHVGRYSFLAADPFEVFRIERAHYGQDPFGELCGRMAQLRAETLPDLPPFQGGAAGLLSYELGRAFERLPVARHDEFELPDLVVGLYDWVLAWDHAAHRAWIISQGFPETELARRTDRAASRLRAVRSRLSAPSPSTPAQSRGRGTRSFETTLTVDRLPPQW